MRFVPAVAIFGAVACGDNIAPETRIAGRMWVDDNHDGVRDPDEAPIAGATVYVNLDLDPSISGNDPITTTDEDGAYELIVSGPGTYEVHPVLSFGQRYPSVEEKRSGAAPIIGGSDASAGQYPFMVSLGQKFDEFVFPFCGGVLITDRHVVTAAHCSAGAPVAEVAVVAGTLDPFAGGQVSDVESIAVHPGFDFFAEDGNDIAVWTLARPVSLDGLATVEMLAEDTVALGEPGTLATTLGCVGSRQCVAAAGARAAGVGRRVRAGVRGRPQLRHADLRGRRRRRHRLLSG